MQPHNPSRLDRNSHFVSKSRTVDLVRKPLGIERLRLFDRKVGTVQADEATRTVAVHVPPVPLNLKKIANGTKVEVNNYTTTSKAGMTL